MCSGAPHWRLMGSCWVTWFSTSKVSETWQFPGCLSTPLFLLPSRALCLCSEGKSNESLKMEFISDPNVTHHPLGPLEPGIHYSISVIARTASGDGPPIQGRSATLLDGGKYSHWPNKTSHWTHLKSKSQSTVAVECKSVIYIDKFHSLIYSLPLLLVPPTNITVIQGSTFLNLSWVPGDRHRNLGFHIQFLRKSGGYSNHLQKKKKNHSCEKETLY